LFDSPLREALAGSRRVLIAGAGGGFDVFAGLPLFFALRDAGSEVHLANLTFAVLGAATGVRRTSALLEVTADSTGPEDYFPELHLCRWLRSRGIEAAVHCFERTGVRPLTHAWRTLVEALAVDAIVLVDGGTDSLMRGDETGVGTAVEDVSSLLAASAVECPRRLLVVTAFGADAFHGVCHADVLEAVAALTRDDAFLGAFSLTRRMAAVQSWRDAVRATVDAMPDHPSIVAASMVDAIDGQFGDVHATRRTHGAELFINPLMCFYWVFALDAVVRRLLYGDGLRETETADEVAAIITSYRHNCVPARAWKRLPF
jgi:hypothetical protein